MTQGTGGSAFPQCSYNMKGGYDITGGATLRDYFAAKAMQGELSAMELDDSGSSGLPIGISEDVLDELANHWFRIGRAMLKARNK